MVEKILGVHKVLLQCKKISVFFNATAESVNCSLFLKNLEKHFCNLTCRYKKNFVKRIENLSQHLSEKFTGTNLSITDIALKIEIHRLSVSLTAFLTLSIIVIALVQKGLLCPSPVSVCNTSGRYFSSLASCYPVICFQSCLQKSNSLLFMLSTC